MKVNSRRVVPKALIEELVLLNSRWFRFLLQEGGRIRIADYMIRGGPGLPISVGNIFCQMIK